MENLSLLFFCVKVASIPKHCCFCSWPDPRRIQVQSGSPTMPCQLPSRWLHQWPLKWTASVLTALTQGCDTLLCSWGSGRDLFHTCSLPTSYRGTEISGKILLITQEQTEHNHVGDSQHFCGFLTSSNSNLMTHSLCLELLMQNRQTAHLSLFSPLGMFGKRKQLSLSAKHTMPNHRHQHPLSLFLKFHSTCTFHFFHNTVTGFNYFLKS